MAKTFDFSQGVRVFGQSRSRSRGMAIGMALGMAVAAAGTAQGAPLKADCPHLRAGADMVGRTFQDGLFAPQLHTNQERNEAENVVFIASNENSGLGDHSFGTGTIVRDSGDATNPRNRIITAMHVADMNSVRQTPLSAPVVGSLKFGQNIVIYDAAGHMLGRGHLEARSGYAAAEPRERESLRADVAVLSVTDTDGRYEAKPGLSLAPTVTQMPMAGLVTNPRPIWEGASGGPVLDEDGRILGVTSMAQPYGNATSARAFMEENNTHGTLFSLIQTPEISRDDLVGFKEEVSVSDASEAHFAPLGNAAVLAALHDAGHVDVVDHLHGPVEVTAYGFPGLMATHYGKFEVVDDLTPFAAGRLINDMVYAASNDTKARPTSMR